MKIEDKLKMVVEVFHPILKKICSYDENACHSLFSTVKLLIQSVSKILEELSSVNDIQRLEALIKAISYLLDEFPSTTENKALGSDLDFLLHFLEYIKEMPTDDAMVG